MRPLRQRRHLRVPPLDLDTLPPDRVAEIVRLRATEAVVDARGTRWQRLCNHMATLYSRPVEVDEIPEGAPYKALDASNRSQPVWRRGRDGQVPTRQAIELPIWNRFIVSPETAEKLIERDGPK